MWHLVAHVNQVGTGVQALNHLGAPFSGKLPESFQGAFHKILRFSQTYFVVHKRLIRRCFGGMASDTPTKKRWTFPSAKSSCSVGGFREVPRGDEGSPVLCATLAGGGEDFDV